MALYPFAGLPLMACLLIGAIVSTTDPSAVVGIFRATPAPQRLARIVEGESLLNDAAAIALFGVFFAFVAVGIPSRVLGEALAGFPWLIAGARWRLGGGAVALSGCAAWGHPLGQVSVSVALPYLVYLLAERCWRLGRGGGGGGGADAELPGAGQAVAPTLAKLRDTWDLLAYWAGGLIFVLAALLVPRLLAEAALRSGADRW
jgi:monovalent cation:H+ antiporter, CPA1 family